MLRVVTTNNVEVFRHLGSGPFQRLDVEHTVATSYDEALAQIQKLQPQIAIVDVDLAGGSGYELCKRVKAMPELDGIHVMMVLSSVISREALTKLEGCGCDDVLAVPLHSDDFYHHIAQVAGLPLRRDRRMGVTLELRIPGEDAPIPGIVDNISAGGAGIVLDGPLEQGQQVVARLLHDGDDYPDLDAVVQWAKPAAEPGKTEAGLAFSNLPMKTRLLLERLCLYDVTETGGSDGRHVTVSLYGDFTEMTDFSTLSQRLQRVDDIDFLMHEVRYISSAGVRAWCDFLAKLKGKSYSFRHCSMAFVSQAAMVPMSVGDGVVVSLEAPYRCETCDRDDLRLLERGALLVEDSHVVPPVLNCSTCGSTLEFDDVPDRYFAFLRS
jgi:CheY-like chemotaxis protein